MDQPETSIETEGEKKKRLKAQSLKKWRMEKVYKA